MKGEIVSLKTAEAVIKLQEKNKELQEDIEYLNHCNEELKKTITNLKYKIKRLEEDLEGKDENI